jgi:hypothetical protein
MNPQLKHQTVMSGQPHSLAVAIPKHYVSIHCIGGLVDPTAHLGTDTQKQIYDYFENQTKNTKKSYKYTQNEPSNRNTNKIQTINVKMGWGVLSSNV